MTILGTKPLPRQPRPSPDQPGSLRQQIESLRLWWRIDEYLRAGDPDGVWQYCRSRFIPHCRKAVA